MLDRYEFDFQKSLIDRQPYESDEEQSIPSTLGRIFFCTLCLSRTLTLISNTILYFKQTQH
jgi:hypothetical protein